MLRPGILDGRVALVTGGGTTVAEHLRALGATVTQEPADRIDMLVYDGGEVFRRQEAGPDPLAPFRACVDGAWEILREVALRAWIPEDLEGGKALVIAPRPFDGAHAAAARAALENAVRTLSIEWARYGVRTVALTPGDATRDEEIAELAGYLASPAGDYFSGTRLDLGAVELSTL